VNETTYKGAGGKIAIVYDVPIYESLMAPAGFLDNHVESHALWTYYTMARHTWEINVNDPIVYEDQLDPQSDFRQLFLSVARMYGVNPENMANCWPQIDLQARALELPLMPDGDQ
jgi:hypothetical protein